LFILSHFAGISTLSDKRDRRKAFKVPEPGAIYVMDLVYLDFEHLHSLHQAPAVFVIRSKSNTDQYRMK
jgi:hypothetical protein